MSNRNKEKDQNVPVNAINKKIQKIYNMGDISLDYHIMTNIDVMRSDKLQITPDSKTYMQLGGAWFTGRLLLKMISKSKFSNIDIEEIHLVPSPHIGIVNGEDKGSDYIAATKISNTFSFVANYQINKGKLAQWRVCQYLGQTNQALAPEIKEKYIEKNKGICFANENILLINEYNSHICNTEDLWPDFDVGASPIIIFRLSNIKENNSLLDKAIKHNNGLVVITTVSDLINKDINIRQGLSWEILVRDLADAIDKGKLQKLRKAQFVVILINRSGVLICDNCSSEESQYTLFWNNKEIEDDYLAKDYGDMRGLNTGFMINVLKAMLLSNENLLSIENIEKGVIVGLNCIEKAYQKGFIEDEKEDTFSFPEKDIIGSDDLYTGKKYSKLKKNCSKVSISNELLENKGSILSSWLDKKKSSTDEVICGELYKFHIDLVKKGEEYVFGDKVPYASFGNLKVINKYEIEEYREIKRLIYSYMKKDEYTRPLSIAVFGKPGNGKSYGIKQIVASFPFHKPEILYFNLSQFRTIDDLIAAFQKIRDESIKGNITLALWDEFDCNFGSEDFGWVKYFLAPMQDSMFFDGAEMHNLGKSIFVFIGSKNESMKQLKAEIDDQDKKREKRQSQNNGEVRNSSKLNDFISRLQGHLDILGINHKDDLGEDIVEIYLRRALILRGILLNRCGSIVKKEDNEIVLSIEDELVERFLTVDKYFHGVRSMESIISMSHIDGRTRYNQSCLPSVEQLKLHVDEKHFYPVSEPKKNKNNEANA